MLFKLDCWAALFLTPILTPHAQPVNWNTIVPKYRTVLTYISTNINSNIRWYIMLLQNMLQLLQENELWWCTILQVRQSYTYQDALIGRAATTNDHSRSRQILREWRGTFVFSRLTFHQFKCCVLNTISILIFPRCSCPVCMLHAAVMQNLPLVCGFLSINSVICSTVSRRVLFNGIMARCR